jgi:hypothetical protein
VATSAFTAGAAGSRRHALLVLAALASTIAMPNDNLADSQDWRTTAERTDYRKTSTYDETVAYCRRLEAASPSVRYTTFGTSPAGRPLPLVVVSRDRAFTPEAARKTGKAVVLVQNGIHSGEIDGKEASLALVRDIAVTGERASLLDHVILLVVPIYNVDGHEMATAYNRINQDGPEEMGWRGTAQNLNLNRDYMKADAPETRALLELFNAWSPDLFIDNHVTDGADFQYDVLYTIESTGYVAGPVGAYVTNVFEPHVRPAMERDGHVVESYFVLRDEVDLAKGIERMIFPPRFSNGYGAIRNRPTILVETHMLKSFRVRTKATYDLLAETLAEVNRDPEALRRAVRQADAETTAFGAKYDPQRRLPLRLAVDDAPVTLRFHGKASRIEPSDVSGGSHVVYEEAARDFDVQLYDHFKAATEVAPPIAYIVPAAWTAVVDRLRVHGLRLERLADPVTADFETYRLDEPKWSAEPFEGRHPVRFSVRPVTERRTLAAGSVVVRLDQSAAKVAVHLLEPGAPDSLASWGFFDAIFEQKEYAEGYVLEQLARRMLDADPALRKEFEERLERDAAFRADPGARLDFFYRRSPYWDSRIGAYPVVRLTAPIALRTEPF